METLVGEQDFPIRDIGNVSDIHKYASEAFGELESPLLEASLPAAKKIFNFSPLSGRMSKVVDEKVVVK